MPTVNFQVSHSQSVLEQFRQLLDTARQEDRLPLVLRAGRYLWDDLAYDPLGFGESRGLLPDAALQMRVGFAGSLYVEFGVHETQKIVFVRRFGLIR